MDEATNKALSAAVVRLLRPLVRLLLRYGMSYGTFAELAKGVFVDVAAKEYPLANRKQSDSRVSVITGLSRKEVARVKKLPILTDVASAKQYNRAARVIGGWQMDPRFCDTSGRPAALPWDGDSASFCNLVKVYSGDMTARAVLDELIRVGAAELLDKGDGDAVQLRAPAYVPARAEDMKLHILGSDVAHLIATVDHNLDGTRAEPLFQRKVSYNNLPLEALPEFRALTQERAQALLEEFNRHLSQQDRDANPAIQGTGRKTAGIGIYYFEHDTPEEKKP